MKWVARLTVYVSSLQTLLLLMLAIDLSLFECFALQRQQLFTLNSFAYLLLILASYSK